MKFLCLHGAYGSSRHFQVQLGPLVNVLQSEGAATFRFVDGQVPVTPPPGFGEYFGPDPHFRYFYDAGIAEKTAMEGIREFPESSSPEDSIRAVIEMRGDQTVSSSPRAEAMRYIYEVLESDPEISGIIGYSEGAMAGASFIIDEIEKKKSQGLIPRIKCGIFFMGWPALNLDGMPILADEVEDTLDVPTLHVVGAKDPYKDGALALYNICNEDTAVLFDTASGHTVPRKGRILDELAQAVRDLIEVSQ